MGVLSGFQKRNVQYVNVPKIIAQYKTKMYMGGGIEFQHKDKKIYEAYKQFEKSNNLYNFIFERTMGISATGGTIIGVLPSESGEPILTYADPYFNNAIECSYATNDVAVFKSKIKLDNQMEILEIFMDKEKIKYTMWSAGANTKDIRLFNYVSKLPKEKQAKFGTWSKEEGCYIYEHNLGVVPFVVIPNVPFIQKWPLLNVNTTNWGFAGLSDTAHSEALVKQLQYAYQQVDKVLPLDRPRILISNASQYMQNAAAKKDAMTQKLLEDDVIMFANAPATAQVKMQTLGMTNDLDKYSNFIQSCWSQIYRNAGLDYPLENGTNKTSAEVYLMFYNTISTIKTMNHNITPYWEQIIAIAMKYKGYDLLKSHEDWYFNIINNLPTDMSSLRQDLAIDFSLGIIDQADIYRRLYDVDRKTAEYKVQSVKEFNKKMGIDPTQIQVSGVSYPKSGVSSANSKNAGRPDEKGKKE